MKKVLLSAVGALGLIGAMTLSPAVWACCGPYDPPEIDNVNADPDVLWPPNHKMVEVFVDVEGSYIDDWRISMIEAANLGPGEGDPNNDPDWVYDPDLYYGPDDTAAVELRAERSGEAGMRFYNLTIEARALPGQGSPNPPIVVTTVKQVQVPHNMGK